MLNILWVLVLLFVRGEFFEPSRGHGTECSYGAAALDPHPLYDHRAWYTYAVQGRFFVKNFGKAHVLAKASLKEPPCRRPR